MRANSRKCARTCKTVGYASKTDKDPNNALDSNNSEVQLIETIINTERCVKGVAYLIYLP